eukprot:8435545-Alexandrium_andersonii.AAC.1
MSPPERLQWPAAMSQSNACARMRSLSTQWGQAEEPKRPRIHIVSSRYASEQPCVASFIYFGNCVLQAKPRRATMCCEVYQCEQPCVASCSQASK